MPANSNKLFTLQPFRPRLMDHIKSYSRSDLLHDAMAGITVAAVALPLAMAFAIASGLNPEYGIFTAIIGGFIISALGGTRLQIGGPAGAFIVVVYAIIERYGIDGLLISTLMSGALLFLLGLFRLGTLVRFVPVAIVIGFTNGIAVLIALSQVKDFLGLQITALPSEFFAKMQSLFMHLHTTNITTLLLGAGCLVFLLGWKHLRNRLPLKLQQKTELLPAPLLVLILGTLVSYAFSLDVETIGTRFGSLPNALPRLTLPVITFETLQQLLPPTITITLLGAIESLLCARVADTLSDDRHNPNQELMAQGLANIASPLFGGYCATGTIARTVTNITCGARTPVSGMIHALTILAVLLAAAPLAAHIPLTALSAILFVVALNMGQWHEFARLRHFTNHYRAILLTTFVLTVIIDLTVAVEVGLVMACLFFIVRVSKLTRIEPVPEIEGFQAAKYQGRVEAYRISGSLFFGAVTKMEGLRDLNRPVPRVLILDMSTMLNIDTSGLEALEALHQFLEKRGATLLICGLPLQAQKMINRSGFAAKMGLENILENLPRAVQKAESLLPLN